MTKDFFDSNGVPDVASMFSKSRCEAGQAIPAVPSAWLPVGGQQVAGDLVRTMRGKARGNKLANIVLKSLATTLASIAARGQVGD